MNTTLRQKTSASLTLLAFAISLFAYGPPGAIAATSSNYTTYNIPTLAMSASEDDFLAFQFKLADDTSLVQDTTITDGDSTDAVHGDPLTAFPDNIKYVDVDGDSAYDDGEVVIQDDDASGTYTDINTETIAAMSLVGGVDAVSATTTITIADDVDASATDLTLNIDGIALALTASQTADQVADTIVAGVGYTNVTAAKGNTNEVVFTAAASGATGNGAITASDLAYDGSAGAATVPSITLANGADAVTATYTATMNRAVDASATDLTLNIDGIALALTASQTADQVADTIVAGVGYTNVTAAKGSTSEVVFTAVASGTAGNGSITASDLAYDGEGDAVLIGTNPTNATTLTAFVATEMFFDADTDTSFDATEDIIKDSGTNTETFDEEVFEALTISNLGTMVLDTDITEMKLWYETFNDNNVFNGTETNVEMTYNNNGHYVFDSVSEIIIPDNIGLRIYITVDTSATLADDKTLQLSVPTLDDTVEIDGSYDDGEFGIFVAGDNDGPSDTAVSGSIIVSGIIGVVSELKSSALNFVSTISDIEDWDSDDEEDYEDDITDAYDEVESEVESGLTTDGDIEDLGDMLKDLIDEIDTVVDQIDSVVLSDNDYDDLAENFNEFVRDDLDATFVAIKGSIPDTLIDDLNDMYQDVQSDINDLQEKIQNFGKLFDPEQLETELDVLYDELQESANSTAEIVSQDELDFFFLRITEMTDDLESIFDLSVQNYDEDEYEDVEDAFYQSYSLFNSIMNDVKNFTGADFDEDDVKELSDDSEDAFDDAEETLIELMPANYSQAQSVIDRFSDIKAQIIDLASTTSAVTDNDDITDYIEDLVDLVGDAERQASKFKQALPEDDEEDYEDIQNSVEEILEEILDAVKAVDDEITTQSLQEDLNDDVADVWPAVNTFLDAVKVARGKNSEYVYIDMRIEMEWFKERADDIEARIDAEVVFDEDDLDEYQAMTTQLIKDVHHSMDMVLCEPLDDDADDAQADAFDAYEDVETAIENIIDAAEDEVNNVNDDDLDDDFDSFQDALQGSSSSSNSSSSSSSSSTSGKYKNTLDGIADHYADVQDVDGCLAVKATETEGDENEEDGANSSSSSSSSSVNTSILYVTSVTFGDLETIYLDISGDVDQDRAEDTDIFTITDIDTAQSDTTDGVSVTDATYSAAINRITLAISGVTAQPGETYKIIIDDLLDIDGDEIDLDAVSFIQPSFEAPSEVSIQSSTDELDASTDDFAEIMITVTDSAGIPVQNEAVTVEQVSGTGGEISIVGASTTNQNGQVTVIYTPGGESTIVILKAYTDEYPEAFGTKTLRVNGSESAQSYSLNVLTNTLTTTGGVYEVKVVDQDGQSVPNTVVTIMISDVSSVAKFTLLPVAYADTTKVYTETTDDNGIATFAIQDTLPEKFDLDVSANIEGYSTPVVTSDRIDLTPADTDLTSGSTGNTETPSSNNGGSTSGASTPTSTDGRVLGASDGGGLPQTGATETLFFFLALGIVAIGGRIRAKYL